MSQPNTAPAAYLQQVDLVALSLAEKVRRRQARENSGVGAWAVVTDAKLIEQIGEEIVRVQEVRGTARVLHAFLNGSSTIAAAGQFKPCLASGDVVMIDRVPTVVLDVVAREPGSPPKAWGVSPRWGVDGASADEPLTSKVDVCDLAREGRAGLTDIRHDAIESRTFAHNHNAMAVRGYLKNENFVHEHSMGPGLGRADFLSVAQFAEPCRVRTDAAGVLKDTFDGRAAVLCDFLGGATLWIWAELLVEFPLVVQWADSPSCDMHPDTNKIQRPSASVSGKPVAEPSPSPPTAPEPAALPASPVPVPVALPQSSMTTTNKIIDSLCAAGKPARGTVIVIDASYEARMKEAVAVIRESYSDHALAELETDDDLKTFQGESCDLGAYDVRKTFEVDLPDGRTFVGVVCTACGHNGSGTKWTFIAALTSVVGGALALPASPNGAVARVAKNVGGKALDVAKDAFVGAKEIVQDEVKRKALAVAQVASQDALVASHETVRRTVLAAGAALVGADDPQAAATNAALEQGFNVMSIMGGRLGARLLAKIAPGTAQVISAATDSLENGIDRKQAKTLLDAAAPAMLDGLKALGQAAVQRFMPALPQAAPAAALPETTPEPPPEVKPVKPKRQRPSRAKPQAGGAQ